MSLINKNISNLTYLFIISLLLSCSSGQEKKLPQEPISCDILISNGTIYDGSGSKPYVGSLAIKDDKIIYVGENTDFQADTVIDATDLAVSPGFINMLSWGYNSLMDDGRALSDLKQGVTLEIFGEGTSPGPYWKDGKFISFGEAMTMLEKKRGICQYRFFPRRGNHKNFRGWLQE